MRGPSFIPMGPVWGGAEVLVKLQEEARPNVAIIAAGARPNDLDRFRDAPEWEIWSCNSIMSPFIEPPTEVHRWFQVHPLAVCDPEEVAWAKLCPIPIYSLDPDQVPMAVEYPMKAILSLPASVGGFASTFAWQVALACLERKRRIALVGLDYSEGGTIRERLVEGPNLAWWVGYALGAGIDVEPGIFNPAFPMDGWCYGWDYWQEREAVAAWCRVLKGEITAMRLDG